MKIYNLKVNGIREPLGYSFEYLTFSWEVSAVKVSQDAIFTVEVAQDELFENSLCCMGSASFIVLIRKHLLVCIL